MNPNQIYTAQAGRELDVLIAQDVFGLSWFKGQYGKYEYLRRNEDVKYVCAKILATGEIRPNKMLPKYSVDMGAAWGVVKYLENHPLEFLFDVVRLSYDGTKNNLLWGVRIRSIGMEKYHYVDADTAPLAICRGALLAVSDKG